MQKKGLPVIALSCLFAVSAGAQIKKGAVLLGGQIGFSATKIENTQAADTKLTSFNFSPAVGWAIKENLLIGVDVLIGYSKNDNVHEKTNFYGAGFFVRQYKELGKGFYVFGQGRVGGYYNREVPTNVTGTLPSLKNYGVQIAFYPGIAYSATKRLQFEAGFNNLAYIQYDHSSNSTITSNSFSLGTSLSSSNAGITLGFRLLLN